MPTAKLEIGRTRGSRSFADRTFIDRMSKVYIRFIGLKMIFNNITLRKYENLHYNQCIVKIVSLKTIKI